MITIAGHGFPTADACAAFLEDLYHALAGCSEPIAKNDEELQEFVDEILPELLATGGRLEAALSPNVWEWHDWMNCPMAAAFRETRVEQIPRHFLPRIPQFVGLYDSGRISRLAALTACRKKGLIPWGTKDGLRISRVSRGRGL